MSDGPTTSTDGPAKAIARGTVALYKEYLGRGATGARVTVNDDFVTVICEQSLTKAEQHLVEIGDQETVRSIRRKFQEAMSLDIRRVVEEATGKKTKTLLSDHDVDLDIAVETVIFE